MTEFRAPRFARPTWTAQVFRGADGNVIDYGNRIWEGSGPPAGAHDSTSNLERFIPLHRMADALIDYLAANYRVNLREGSDVAADLEPAPAAFERLVRIEPIGSDGGRATIVLTPFPGVMLYTDAGIPDAFPACGCDACDDHVDDLADELKERALALPQELRWQRRM